MSSEARLAPADRSSTDKRASISLATRSLGGTLDMGLVSSPVFSSANHFRGTRPFPFYRHSRTLPFPILGSRVPQVNYIDAFAGCVWQDQNEENGHVRMRTIRGMRGDARRAR